MTTATKKMTKAELVDRVEELEERLAQLGGGGGLVVPFVRTEKYAQRRVHQHLEAHQAETLRAVLEGLELQSATLNDGHVVRNSQDAIRWLLEEIERSNS